MGASIWETCMLVPGFTRTECAAWVQAWGSVAAIGAAITIAWWQRRNERTEAALRAQARAELAATGVLLKLPPLVGWLQAVAGEIKGAVADPACPIDTKSLGETFKRQPYPTEEEVLALADHDPAGARILVRARNLVRQSELALFLLAEHVGSPHFVSHMKYVLALVERAREQFEKAGDRLDKLASQSDG